MRSVLGVAASALAGVAAIVASLAEPSISPFYIGLTFLGGVEAAMAFPPFEGWRRLVARTVASLWLVAAVWAGLLLLAYLGGHSGPQPVPELTFLAVPATVYHVAGLYGGLAFVMTSAFGPDRWCEP